MGRSLIILIAVIVPKHFACVMSSKDGVSYRFMGKEAPEKETPVRFEKAAVQQSVNVLPTQTYYTFKCGPVCLDLVFTSPLLLEDLDRMSTPVNYISWQVRAMDEKAHETRLTIDFSTGILEI